MLLDCASIPTCQHMAVLSSSVARSEHRMHFTYRYTPKKVHKSDNTATTGI